MSTRVFILLIITSQIYSKDTEKEKKYGKGALVDI
jgi:hypothetical protein